MSPSVIDTSLEAFSEEELGICFDELTEISINQPDDEVALRGLREIVIEARDRGYLDTAMQMAMTLGAMACLHPHLEDTANEAGHSLDGHHDKESDKHNSSNCANCRAGRSCPKKH